MRHAEVYLSSALPPASIPRLQASSDEEPVPPAAGAAAPTSTFSSSSASAPRAPLHAPALHLHWLQTWDAVLRGAAHDVPLRLRLAGAQDTQDARLTALECRAGHAMTLHVRDLTSPIGRYSAALVRLDDVDCAEAKLSTDAFAELCGIATKARTGQILGEGAAAAPAVSPPRPPPAPPAGLAAASMSGRRRNPFDRSVQKYWSQRHHIFSKFDNIQTDREGLFSATPECVAVHVAEKMLRWWLPPSAPGSHPSPVPAAGGITVVDAFCGVGGNCIHFAARGMHVVAVDISLERLEMARHNAAVYGVADRIDFVLGDFLALAPRLRADAVVLSPPWGGPAYQIRDDPSSLDLASVISVPCGGIELLRVARTVSDRVVYMLPKDVNRESLRTAAGQTEEVEVEDMFVNSAKKMTVSYHCQRLSR